MQVAVIQPKTVFGDDAREQNLELAWKYARQAAMQGAHIACFPETFPGAWRMPVSWTPLVDLAEIARETGIYLIGSYSEPLDAKGQRCYMSVSLIDPAGKEVGRYRRTTPAHAPWIYKGGARWDIEWVNATDLPVFETDFGKVGLLVCSEVYATELARGLALKGAEFVFMPAGLVGPYNSLFDTWKTLVWARAIENLMYTAVCANAGAPHYEGLAMICSPEQILIESCEEGVHLATVDLERVRWLRNEQDRISAGRNPLATPWRTKPGTLRDWRRQAVFDTNPAIITGNPDPVANRSAK